MSELITIVHHKVSGFFGKPERIEYEGVKFSNGKVAYVDNDGAILAYERQETLLDALKKHGEAEIQRPHKKERRKTS